MKKAALIFMLMSVFPGLSLSQGYMTMDCVSTNTASATNASCTAVAEMMGKGPTWNSWGTLAVFSNTVTGLDENFSVWRQAQVSKGTNAVNAATASYLTTSVCAGTAAVFTYHADWISVTNYMDTINLVPKD